MAVTESRWLDKVGAVIALTIVGVYAFTVIMPYFLPPVTNPELIQLLDRTKGTVDTVTVAVVMFFFGGTVGRRMLESSIDKQADAIITAQAMPAPVQPDQTIITESRETTTTKTND